MINFFSGVSSKEKILFAKHMAIMIKAGMSILESLKLIKKLTKSRRMTKILDELINDVSNGQFLSTSLEKFHNIFGDFAINIIRVGEGSGILYENLNYLAEELKKKQELRKNVLSALTYPAIVIFASISLVALLTLYVFPKIVPILENLKGEPPLPTRILITMSQFLQAYWLYLLIGLIAFSIISSILVSRVALVKLFFHRLILSTPLISRISRNYNLTTMGRTLGLLLKSDIKVVEALYITSDTLTNLIFKRELKIFAEDVSRGEEISRHLEKKPQIFPIMFTQMVAIGEKTGNLSETLLYLADVYENELNDLTKNLSTIIEPVIMIILGGIVAFIAISIIAPIYQITQMI